MIQSMTGYGKAVTELPNKKITVELKSLNSKQLDLSARIPGIYREKEMAIRSLLSQKLERGKVDFSIYVENTGKDAATQINQSILHSYYLQIKQISENLGIELPQDWFSTLLRMPEVMKSEMQELEEAEWKEVEKTIYCAVEKLISFRNQEGNMLKELLKQKITNIARLQKEIECYEKERIEKIKQRIIEALEKIEIFDYDKNRFEQEMIYYIEKLDVNEEKIRLDNHLTYFLETMENVSSGQGKKLGFITQEIGREINTLGSKSNHAEMQKIVVRMKDELEQIKEQVLNIL
ncbi:MAG: YicC family protein [Candidatus Azobacteroides sp.]|nr:YicC family protein [Candidatus Azobacteroides sp.]